MVVSRSTGVREKVVVTPAGAVGPGADVTAILRKTIPATMGVLIITVSASMLLGWLATRYAEWIISVIGADSDLVEPLLFSAFPLALALAVAIRRPRSFGIHLGDSLVQWRLTLEMTLALCGLAVVALSLLGSNPFSGASLVVEVVAVPLGEELLFRGVVFTFVLLVLSRSHPVRRATLLAVLINGVGFGLAHLNDLGSYDLTFVMLQSANATVLGIAAAHLRASTRSVYPAIVLHAAVNLVAVAM